MDKASFVATGQSWADKGPKHDPDPLPGGSWGVKAVVQLKREALLKWKTAQLERQVTMLQAALQVHTNLLSSVP